jgi:hypothetical protein
MFSAIDLPFADFAAPGRRSRLALLPPNFCNIDVFNLMTKPKALTNSRNIALSLLLAISLPALFQQDASAKSKILNSEKIQINADSKTVFEAIKASRNSEALHRKCLLTTTNGAIVEENLQDIPVLGNVHCLWSEREISSERIDYELTQSDKFIAGSGSYIISPSSKNGLTTLELQSHVDSGLHIPFAHEICTAATRHDMKTRLHLLKQIAERDQHKKIASAN